MGFSSDPDLAALLPDAIEDYRASWKPVDDDLYDLCQVRLPRHDDQLDVYTKVVIVGRVYSAQVVRAWPGVRDSENETAKVLKDEAARVEEVLHGLAGRPFGPDAAREVVELHRDLIDAIHGRCGKFLTSFVSKYLHFHCPIVPIVDSEADAAIGKLVDRGGKRVREARTALPDGGGPDEARVYRSFVGAFVVLHERARATPEPSVKELDHMLWWTMNSRAITKTTR
jgi:hypothetical protein